LLIAFVLWGFTRHGLYVSLLCYTHAILIMCVLQKM